MDTGELRLPIPQTHKGLRIVLAVFALTPDALEGRVVGAAGPLAGDECRDEHQHDREAQQESCSSDHVARVTRLTDR